MEMIILFISQECYQAGLIEYLWIKLAEISVAERSKYIYHLCLLRHSFISRLSKLDLLPLDKVEASIGPFPECQANN